MTRHYSESRRDAYRAAERKRAERTVQRRRARTVKYSDAPATGASSWFAARDSFHTLGRI